MNRERVDASFMAVKLDLRQYGGGESLRVLRILP